MSKKDVLEEMEDEAVAVVEAAPEEEKPVYVMLDGTETHSRAEFIREQFTSENKTRKQIAEEFEIPYQAVYQSTVNMTNDAEAASGSGRAKVYVEVDGKKIARNDYIVQLAEAGMNRKDILTKLIELTGEDIKYQVIYNATKSIEGMGGTRGAKIMIEVDGVNIPRTEYIKSLHAEGSNVSTIAKKLGVSYQTVYSVVGNSTKAKVTIKASTLEELDTAYEAARVELIGILAKEADEAGEEA